MTNIGHKQSAVKRLMEESDDPFYHLKDNAESTIETETVEVEAEVESLGASTSRFAEVRPSKKVVGSDDPNDDGYHRQPTPNAVASEEVIDNPNADALAVLRNIGIQRVSPKRSGLLKRAGGLAMVLGVMWGVQKAVPELGRPQPASASASTSQSLEGWQNSYAISQAAVKAAQGVTGAQTAKGAREGAWTVLNSLFGQVKDREAKMAFFASAVQLAMGEPTPGRLAALYAQGYRWTESSEEFKQDHRLAAVMQAAANKLSTLSAQYPQTSQNWQVRASEWAEIARDNQRTVKGAGWQAETQLEIRQALATAGNTAANRSARGSRKDWQRGFEKPFVEAQKTFSAKIGSPKTARR